MKKILLSIFISLCLVGSALAIPPTPPFSGHVDTLALSGRTTLTISSGAVTVTKSFHSIDTQSGAASDDLDTIDGGTDGQILIIGPAHADRTIVVKSNTGNIYSAGADITLDDTNKGLLLVYNSTLAKWVVEGGSGTTTAAGVSDAPYDQLSWDGVTTTAPSKNAVRDKIESLVIPTLTDSTSTTSSIVAASATAVKAAYDHYPTVTDSTSTTSSTTVASATAVKAAYDHAPTLTDSTSTTSSTVAASATAVKAAYDLANGKQASDADLTSIAGGVTGIVKGAGNGNGFSAASAGTDYQAALTYPVTGVASPTAGYLTKWAPSGNAIVDGPKLGTLTDTKFCTYTTADGLVCTSDGTAAMTYPGAGVGVSTGSAWGASLNITAISDSTSTTSSTTAASATAVKSAYDTGAAKAGLTSPAFVTDIHASTAGGATNGTAALPWSTIYFSGTSSTPATNHFKLTGASTGGERTVTFPDVTGTAVVGATSATATQALFATATAGAPAFRAVAAADLPATLSSGTAVTNAALTTPAVTTSIAPASAGGSTLGTTALEWGNAYFTDSAVIYAQADQSNTMTSSATGWTFNQPVTFGPQTTTAGSIYFQEGSGGGTNKVRLQGAASTADVTVTLPAATGTITAGPTSTTAGQVWTATSTAGLGAWSSAGAGDVVAANTSQTWGDGTGPVVWTFGVTGTDPTLTATASLLKTNGTLEAAAFQATKATGVAGDSGLYEANSTDTSAAGFRGPSSLTYSYRGQFPTTRAASASQALVWTNAGESGSGTDSDPYVQAMSWASVLTNPMTAVGDIIIGGTSGAPTGKLADVAAGQPLLSGGVATAPAYAGYTFSGTAAATYTFPGSTKTLAASDGSNLAFGSDAQDDVAVRGASAYGRLNLTEQTILGRATGGHLAAIAIDSDLSSVSGSDDTIPSAKAVKAVTDARANTTSPAFTTDIHAATAGGATNGTAALPWSTIYFAGTSSTPATNHFKLTGASTGGERTVTFPDVTGTVVVGGTSTTATQAMFATATAGSPAFRAVAAADLPATLSSGTAVTNAALTTPSVTTSIAPVTAGAATDGTAALPWSSVYIGNAATNNIQLTGTAASAKVVTLPGQTGTITVGPTSTTAGEVWTATAVAGVGAWASPGATDAELAAIAGLTFADASIIQLTGDHAAATLTSGGNHYFLKSTSDNSALEFATPAASLTALGAAPLAAPVFTTSIEAPYLILGSSATAADAGAIRMPNAAYIMSEADAAGTDISVIGVDSAEIIQIGASGASSVTITPNTTITGDLTVSGADIVFPSATAGVRLTGGNGLLTIKGEGDGTDEDLTINLNSANVATISSSTGVTDVNFSALNLVTTGAIHGGIEIIADDTSLSAAQCYGSFNDTNGTETITLPAATVGMNVMIYSNDATVKTIDPNGSEVIELNGTALTGGYAIKSPGAAGNFITLICRTAGVWTTLGMSGTWVTNGS